LIQIDRSLLGEWYMSVQHACFQALVDFIGIYASISEKLVHRLLPCRLLALATFLLGSLTRPSINDAGHELIFGACLGEVRIRAHLLHLSNVEIPQRLVVGLEPPNEAGHELRLVARPGELGILAHLLQLWKGLLAQREITWLLWISVARSGWTWVGPARSRWPGVGHGRSR